ncbi:hypothetical protein D3C71_2228440 [compost metagenome]
MQFHLLAHDRDGSSDILDIAGGAHHVALHGGQYVVAADRLGIAAFEGTKEQAVGFHRQTQ